MPGPASRRMTRFLARILSSIFYREVEVEGAEKIPGEGPLIYAVNHPNALVDPLLIHGLLPRHPRFLAKHGLWDIPVVRPFLEMAGSIPVYRQMDRDARTVQNLETFDACYRALAEGAVIGIFPEGVSHTEPSMMPVKTGIARIVLGAEERHGPLGVRIIPVGLTFDARQRFRSRVLITVGDPIGPVESIPRERGELRRLRNALTGEIEGALRRVTLNYGSRREARLIERAGLLYARMPSALPERPDLSDLFEVRKQFSDGYRVMKELLPERVGAVARSVDTYDRMLRATGFTDEQVVSSYPWGRIFGYLMRTLLRLCVYSPLAAVGALLNWLPYRVTDMIARPLEKRPQDPATRKIFGGLFIFPAAWIIEAAVFGLLLDWRWAAALLLLAPATGWFAMRFQEESESLWSESFNYLRLSSHRRTWRELRKRREALHGEIIALAERYLETISRRNGPPEPRQDRSVPAS